MSIDGRRGELNNMSGFFFVKHFKRKRTKRFKNTELPKHIERIIIFFKKSTNKEIGK